MPDTILPIREFSLQSNDPHSPFIIAGPCSVESRQQIIDTALQLAEINNVTVLRAGIWKPRTLPGSFEGLGEKGLPWLKEAAEKSGLYAATEVATSAHARAAIDAGIDILWIGARTAVNPFAVQELAETIAAIAPDIPVMIKNPVNPDTNLWIGAFRRFLQVGVRHLAAIHRGFSAFDTKPYRNLPMWQIPMELHRRMPDLPIIHDPSHTGGSTQLLKPLSQQALDLGFDGLMVETHPNPSEALSDGGQQITPDELKIMLGKLVIKHDYAEPDDELTILRHGIDACDLQLLETLARRMSLSKKIGQYKLAHNIKVLQPDRYQKLLSVLVAKGSAEGLDHAFLERLFELIHEESVRLQLDL